MGPSRYRNSLKFYNDGRTLMFRDMFALPGTQTALCSIPAGVTRGCDVENMSVGFLPIMHTDSLDSI